MPSHDARTIRGAAIPTAVAGVLATAISAGIAGGKGAIGAGFAAVLVLLFFAAGQIALDRFTRNTPQLMMAVALMVYTTQILLVAIVLAVFKDTTLFDTKVFAFTLLGCVFIWCGGQVRAHLKTKQFYVQTDDKPDERLMPGRQQ
jgi:ATP synthase protein I